MNRKIMKSMGLVIIVTLSIFTCQIFPNRDNPTVNSIITPLTKDNLFDIQEKYDDYLMTARGTEFLVRIESEQEFTAYNEYSVNVTVQLLAFGTNVDRIYDIFFDLSLVWSGGFWNSTVREIPEIDTIGAYEYTIFGIVLNEGDFGPLDNNEEVSMTLYYHIEVTEGVVLAPDDTSEGLLSTYGITYVNVEVIPENDIYDLDLPAVYSDRETKMGIHVRTNANWKTDEYYTFFVSFSALEFPWDIDRFHSISFELHFKYSGYDYYSTSSDLEVALGDTITYQFQISIPDDYFGGIGEGNQITVQLWYEMYYKEGVILEIDPEYNVGPNYIFDINLANVAEIGYTGTKEVHTLNLDTSVVLTHMTSKSIIIDRPNINLNFTLFFAFNIYVEISNEIILESYTLEEISSMNPFNLFMLLKENNADVSIGAKPEFGAIIR